MEKNTSKYYMEKCCKSLFACKAWQTQKLIHIFDDVCDKDNTVMEKMPLNIMQKNPARHFLQAKYDYGRHVHELVHVFYEV